MLVSEILAELGRRGVSLFPKGDRLRFWPKSALTPELLAELREHKAELIAVCAKSEMGERKDRNLGEIGHLRPASDSEDRKLVAAGWEPKERCGKLIWKHPDNGFYYSQDMAKCLSNRGVSDVRCKSGAMVRR